MKLSVFLLLTASFSIYFISSLFAYTGEVILSFNTPGKYPTGMTYDGKNLWLADRYDDKLYCIDPANGKVIRSIPSPGYWPMGLAWDGEALWNADIKGGLPLAENYNGKIYRIDPKDGTVLHTVLAPSGAPGGLTWDGTYLWCSDHFTDEVMQFDPGDGTTIRSFKAPAKDPRGMTFDGKYLWISDRINDEIYMSDPANGNVILVTDAPGKYVRGLCYDGKHLWAVDYQDKKIYKLKVNDDEKFIRYDEHHGKVTYTHQTTNFGPGNVKTADVHFALATERDNQVINGELQFSPKYTDIVTDKWGQKTAHWLHKDIKPGEARTIRITTDIKTYAVRYFIFPEKAGSLDDIPGEIKGKYLENNEKYQTDHPYIQKAVKKVVGDEKNTYMIARNIFNYLIENMYYEMAGGWNTAPAVLERGNGSCSEYSFVYIAMCRAAGVPARYVGSVVVRGDDASMDDVFHRWVEVFLPNYGWIPVDPSGGDRDLPCDQARYFGGLSRRFYITTQSGGGSETMGWTYNSNEFWTADPKTNVVFEHFADWEPAE